MSVKYTVLEKLRTKSFSGQELANELGVSRNSIWKAVNSLRKDGYVIEGQTNLGYKLVSFGDVLSADSVASVCKTKDLDLYVYESISSTNTVLKEWAQKNYKEGTVIVAKEQTQGKGRLGRKFSSPSETGVYISILLRPKFSADEALSITTAAAVAVAKTLEEISGKETKIKWVNDIFIDDKKVCGILTEASIDFETASLSYAVLGVGINLREPENGFENDIKNIAGAVFKDEIPEQIRAKTVAIFIDNFFEIYNNLPDNSFIEEYRNRSYLTGKEVNMLIGENNEKGVVVDIDDKARLLVKLETGEIKAFSAGEAMIKKGLSEKI
ncbi:MAG: biotin--[acetyl-CoA-carboxylase] ligase [Clostridia bacterium]